MNPDFKQALQPIEYEIALRPVRGFESVPLSDTQLETIRKALQIADALMGEPTEAMCGAASEIDRQVVEHGTPHGYDALFKAMRDELLKRIL